MKVLKQYSDIISNVECPLCHSNHAELLYSVDSNFAAKHIKLENDSSIVAIIEKIWGSKSSHFVKCMNCSFSYAWPFKSGTKEFYSRMYSGSDYYPKGKWDYNVTFNSISHIVSNNDPNQISLLEIGAGNGSFVKSISPKLIPKKNILCTEFSDYGKNEILKYDINCMYVSGFRASG